ncbi:MAG: 6,7-dimethyl-8-ribityllumazine synthase [bacterium]|nr:6,7-dimethyl-8-ribityllumazine synthase [bacterium]
MNKKIVIVRSRFNQEITSGLLKGALKALKQEKVPEKNIKIVEVPGAWEIPLAVHKLGQTKKYTAIIALGAVIKGETTHDYWINHAIFPALQFIARQYCLPVTLGIITCQTWKQALARSGNNKDNRGYAAAQAAVEMIKTLKF